MATHPSILAWEILWTGEPGRLQSMGLQKSQTGLSDKINSSNHFIGEKTENRRGRSARTHSQEVEGPGIRIIYIQITSPTRRNRPLHLRICSSDTSPFRLWVLGGSLSPLSHCVPAAHSLLLKALLEPSLIHSACSPHLLRRVIITPHCGCEKAASICTKQDSSGPVSLGMRQDLWNKTKNKKPVPSWLRSHHRFILNPSPCVLWELLAHLILLTSLAASREPPWFPLVHPMAQFSVHLFPHLLHWLLGSGSLEIVFGPSWLEVASVLFSQSSLWSGGSLPFCTFTNSLNKHLFTF